MIGEAWATGCIDAAISLEWMQCEQIPIPVPRPGGGSSDLSRQQLIARAIKDDREIEEIVAGLAASGYLHSI